MSEIDKLKDIQDKLCDLAADLKVTTDEAQSALADAEVQSALADAEVQSALADAEVEMQECKEELEGFVSVFIDGEVFFKGNIIQMYHIKDYIEENFK